MNPWTESVCAQRARPAAHPRLWLGLLSALALLGACAPAEAAPPLPEPASPITNWSELEPKSSRVSTVVIFPTHAQLTRTLQVEAQAGENRLLFGGLVPNLDPQTLRASVSEGARVTGTEIKTLHLEQSSTEQIADLDQAIQDLEDTLTERAMQETRVQERAAFYRSVKGRLASDMEAQFVGGSIPVTSWSEVLGFVGDGLAGCDKELVEIGLERRSLLGRRDAARAERQGYAGLEAHTEKQVAVTFQAEQAGPMTVNVHYMVSDVIWKPSYDVHLDRATGALEIIGYGHIKQWTGESWTDVDLSLAMSRPDHQLALPALTPLVASLDQTALRKLAKEASFLGLSKGQAAQKWAAGRFAGRQDRETFRRNLEQLARLPRDRMTALGLSPEILEEALSHLINRFSGVRYQIAQRATIPFDSSPHKVVTFAARVPAQLRYVATPALGDTVMLQAVATNSTGHPMLAGTAALYVDGAYAGASELGGAAQNEGISFSFGPDDALVVKRRLISRSVKGPEAFRQSQVLTYHYAITVENFNDRDVEVHVVDQIPISKTAEIQVSFLNSTEPHTLYPETGALIWNLSMPAGKRTEVDYSFSVECPIGQDVHWQ